MPRRFIVLIISLVCLYLIMFGSVEEIQTLSASENKDSLGSFEKLRIGLVKAIGHVDDKGN